MLWRQGEVDAVLLSVSLVREMRIQLPLSNLTGPDLVEKTAKEASNCSPSDPPSGSLQTAPGVDGSFHEADTQRMSSIVRDIVAFIVDRNRFWTLVHFLSIWVHYASLHDHCRLLDISLFIYSVDQLFGLLNLSLFPKPDAE